MGAFSDAAFSPAIYGGGIHNGLITKTHLNSVHVSYDRTQQHYGVTLTLDNGEVDSDAWHTFLGLTNLAYLSDRSAVVTVTDSAQPQVIVDKPMLYDEPADASADATGVWADIYDSFADEPEVVDAVTALRACGAGEPDPEFVGEEVDGLTIIARWPEYNALFVFDGDGARNSPVPALRCSKPTLGLHRKMCRLPCAAHYI